MIRRITTFDPSTGSMAEQSKFFTNTLPSGVGFLLIWNDSPINLIFQFGSHQQTIVAGTFDVIELTESAAIIYWWQDFILANAGQSPVTRVTVDGASVDEALVIHNKTYPIALPRVQNVGNQVSTTGTNSLINDGQVAGTQVIEATPQGSASSNMSLDNRGSGFLGSGNLLIGTTALTTQNGYTVAATSVPATGVTTGALPAGVTLAATQVTTGALPAGVTLAATQVTAGALPAGVTLAASSLTTGIAPTGVEIGTSSTNKVTMNGIGGGSQVGIISTGNATWIISDINVGFMYGAYFNGSGYVTISNTGKFVEQALISTDAIGGSTPHFNARRSTGTSTGGGQNVTWGSWFCFAEMVDTGARTPCHVFTNTTTPSGAVAGDIWVKA